jgi:hypothetical protein
VGVRHTHLGHCDPKLAGRLWRGHEDVHAAPVACGNPVVEDKGANSFQDHARAKRHPKGPFYIPGEGDNPWPDAAPRGCLAGMTVGRDCYPQAGRWRLMWLWGTLRRSGTRPRGACCDIDRVAAEAEGARQQDDPRKAYSHRGLLCIRRSPARAEEGYGGNEAKCSLQRIPGLAEELQKWLTAHRENFYPRLPVTMVDQMLHVPEQKPYYRALI